MFANERRIKIAEDAGEAFFCYGCVELTDAFQVSLETIRRDLSIWRGRGALKRVHGEL